MKKGFILALFFASFATHAQVTITAKGRNTTKTEKDFRGNDVVTITCDAFWNEECYTLQTNGPVITRNAYVMMRTYGSKPVEKEGYLLDYLIDESNEGGINESTFVLSKDKDSK